MRPQTRPMPENTVDQIDDGLVNEFADLQDDNPRQDTGGILAKLAEALGVTPAKIATVLGSALPGKSKLNATCKCGRKYKYFSDEGYQEDQSICPPCRDQAMAASREAAMRPEKLAAAKTIREQEAQAATKKNDERKELVTLVAETVAQLQNAKT